MGSRKKKKIHPGMCAHSTFVYKESDPMGKEGQNVRLNGKLVLWKTIELNSIKESDSTNFNKRE